MAKANSNIRAEAFADELAERLRDWGAITRRPLFGAVALCRDGLVFAMIWQSELYFKTDNLNRQAYIDADSHPLPYRSKGRDLALKSFWQVPPDAIEEDEIFFQWAESAWQAAMRSHSR